MKGYYDLCPICKQKPTDTAHHMFEQYKWRKNLYPDYIHDERNLQYLCHDCHLQKKEGIIFFTEDEFCKIMGIEKRGKL